MAAGRKQCATAIRAAIEIRMGGTNYQCGTPLQAGFTLIELMVVIMMIMIVMGIAIPMYNQSILHARERVLRDDLDTLNKLIVEYTRDKQKAPQSLDDLVTAKYLKQLPVDPITRDKNWEVEEGEFLLTVDQQDPGITGVHSASNATGSNGVAYSQW